uniref:Putative lipopolysaccharide and beta-1,3-glucan-binding protein n=1 Tax=Pinctada fucata TaxID=50426 RepID=A0A194AJ48_PINFU
MGSLAFFVLALALVLCPSIKAMEQATMTLIKPDKLQIKMKDEGYAFVAVHYSINSPVHDVAAGQWNYDVHDREGNYFVHKNTNGQLHVKPGDKVYYWLHGQGRDGHVDEFKNQVAIVTDPYATTTTTTTTKPTTTTTTRTTKTTTTQHRPIVTTQQAPDPVHGIVIGGGSETGNSIGTVSGNSNNNIGVGIPDSGGIHTLPQTQSNTQGSSQSGGGGSSCGDTCQCSCKGAQAEPACTSYPCLIFEDNFDFLNHEVWEHEISASGGGNWEFEYYTNNRSNSYCHDGKLFIKPTLTADRFGEQFLTSGSLDLWGARPNDECTSNQFWGCQRQGTGSNMLNPIQSAKIKSYRGFNFKYGKMEVRAKMPKGDWLWPAIWLLPERNAYGTWPASGEIDIIESRGNKDYHDPNGKSLGVDSFGSTLHFGPNLENDPWYKAHAEKTLPSGTLADDFHTWVMIWDEQHINISFEGEQILNIPAPPGGFWKFGDLDQKIPDVDNPYRYAQSNMAPFDQPFYIIINLAVGGIGFFDDSNINKPYPKPWNNKSPTAPRDFWSQKNQWYPTWNPKQNNGEDAALQVDYIRVWKMKP